MTDDRDLRARRHGFTTHRSYVRSLVAAAAPGKPTICFTCGGGFEWPDARTYHCPTCGYTRELTTTNTEA